MKKQTEEQRVMYVFISPFTSAVIWSIPSVKLILRVNSDDMMIDTYINTTKSNVNSFKNY